MTRRGRVLLWMSALFLCIPLLAQDSSKARVLALENAWNEAEGHNDANALAVLLAPTFVYTDAVSWTSSDFWPASANQVPARSSMRG